MKNVFFALSFALASAVGTSAMKIQFVNQCDFRMVSPELLWHLNLTMPFRSAVWAAVGAAPWGNPDPSIAFGKMLQHNGGTTSFSISDNAVVRLTAEFLFTFLTCLC
jgi:hypothetical protein